MFFADSMAAFRNIRGALAANGRLVMMVWQAREANEWSMAVHGDHAQSTAAFSLADPATAERMLDAAGFAQTTFQDVHEPVYYGDSVEAALDWIGQFQATRDALQSLDAASAERERARLCGIAAQHYRDQACGSTRGRGSSALVAGDAMSRSHRARCESLLRPKKKRRRAPPTINLYATGGLAARPRAFMQHRRPVEMAGNRSEAMTDPQTYYHGTKADLKVGDLIEPGYASNYFERKPGNFHLPERHTGCGHLGSRTGGWPRAWQDLHRGTHRLH